MDLWPRRDHWCVRMEPNGQFDMALETSALWSDAERAEVVLTYLSAILEAMDDSTLYSFRDECMARGPYAVDGKVFELIERLLVLRRPF